MRKVFVVANPVSGRNKSLRALKNLKLRLDELGLSHEVFLTEKDRNAEFQIKTHLTDEFSDLIIIGGDGTLNEAVNGLNRQIPIGIIPTGSGNDYAKCFDFGTTLSEQIQTAINGEPKPVDVGLCNGRKFLNGVGVGFDGQIVADMVQQKTMIKGPAKYYYHVLKILASYAPRKFVFTAESGINEENLILLCIAKGTTFGGSFVLTPDSQLDDGYLHVCKVGELSPIKRFLNVPALMKGKHGRLDEVSFFKTKNLTIQPQPSLNAHIDGEFFGNPPFQFSVIPKGILVRTLG